jgi:hypothetical protein
MDNGSISPGVDVLLFLDFELKKVAIEDEQNMIAASTEKTTVQGTIS